LILQLKRTPGIFLAGFMGSGKSTVGHALAHELGWSFRDLDQDIEDAEGATIPEIFDQRGEPEFRRLESEALRRCVRMIQHGRPQVVALGGGAFLSEENYQLVSHNGVAIWLDCPLALIEKRLEGTSHRPLARDPQRLRALFESRREGYARAEFRVETNGDDPQAAVARILELGLF
jgi:shikimate kinase